MAITTKASELGRWGEQRAAEYVESLGWEVVDRNWRCPSGEIDIVAWDEQTGTLVVVEVKSRSGRAYGDPLEAITDAKASRLVRLAAAWLRENEVSVPRVRVDAIGIVAPRGQDCEITHLPGIGGL